MNRAGDGEYRVNGAKCRLVDVIEILSDTGLGKEMHSVVSQGRVEAIVTSKPRDRRMLIEEAAGLGKHRKRRRRAQLKLERTQDNLDRALDVEREARTRLKPLKRQAEAAELHERIERQSDEARWTLARDAARSARAALASAEAAAAAARAAAEATEKRTGGGGPAPRGRPRRHWRRAAPSARRCPRGSTPPARRPNGSRCGLEAATRVASELADRAGRRRETIAQLEAEAAADPGDDGAEERIAALQAELAELAEDYRTRLERELAELEERREAATALVAQRAEEATAAASRRAEGDAAAEAARTRPPRAGHGRRSRPPRVGEGRRRAGQGQPVPARQRRRPRRRRRRWPTRSPPPRATNWRSPPPSARACAPPSRPTSLPAPRCWSGRARTEAPR